VHRDAVTSGGLLKGPAPSAPLDPAGLERHEVQELFAFQRPGRGSRRAGPRADQAAKGGVHYGTVTGVSTGENLPFSGPSALARGSAQEDPGEFKIRSLIPLNDDRLASLRDLVAEDPAAARVARQIVTAAAAIVDRTPRPLAVIHYEGLVNTDPRRITGVKDLLQLDEVSTLVRAWQIK